MPITAGQSPKCNMDASSAFIIQFKHIPSNKVVRFPAFLKDFSDTFTPSWNEEEVFGRMDPISVYKRTSRVISITWTVLSINQKDGIENLERINKFMNFLYPSFSKAHGEEGGTLMKTPPLLQMRFSNLIVNGSKEKNGWLLGYINGPVAFKPNVEEGFLFSDDGMLLPREIEMSCTFVVLHQHELGWNGASFPTNFPYKKGLHSPRLPGAPRPKSEDPVEVGGPKTEVDKRKGEPEPTHGNQGKEKTKKQANAEEKEQRRIERENDAAAKRRLGGKRRRTNVSNEGKKYRVKNLAVDRGGTALNAP